MTMDMTVESSRDTKSAPTPVPKRSFDVAFLTGNADTCSQEKRTADSDVKPTRMSPLSTSSSSPPPLKLSKTPESDSQRLDRTGSQDKLHSGHGASAFKKVSKAAGQATSTTTAATVAAAAAAAASLSEMLPSNYPFSFPAIATTLSLQLLQQNSKGLAMSLFNPMNSSLLPNASKMGAYTNMMPPASAAPSRQSPMVMNRFTEPSDRSNLIEDYLRAHASLYHDKDLNMGGLFGSMGHSKNGRLSSSSASSSGSEALSLVMSASASNSFSSPSYTFSHMAADHRSVNSVGGPMSQSSMLPPSGPVLAPPMLPVPAALASLSSPSQNVCAKCNLSFRMTSDLVYHMRSQHRRESDPVRQKRQEKLRCPVCGESFRERHHLTRHMTSHEDREVEAK